MNNPVSGLGRGMRGCSKQQDINRTFINTHVGFHPPHTQIGSDASTVAAQSHVCSDSVVVHRRRLSCSLRGRPHERVRADDLAGPYHPLNTARNDSMSHLSVESSVPSDGGMRKKTLTRISEHVSLEAGGRKNVVSASGVEQVEHRRLAREEMHVVGQSRGSPRPNASADANDGRERRSDRIKNV